MLIENAASPFEMEKLQDRLGRMIGGVSIIHVGGYNETEMHEKKDRVDDALNATKAALEEGIVPGGGAALVYASEILNHKDSSLSQDFCLGIDLVKKACHKPLEQILINAGYDASVIYETINTILDSDDTWTGFDLKNESYIDMRKSGIIDPTKVTRTALENASSVAGTVLLTECVVVEEPSEESAAPDYNGMF